MSVAEIDSPSHESTESRAFTAGAAVLGSVALVSLGGTK